MYTIETIREHLVMYSLLWASGFTAGWAVRLVAFQLRDRFQGPAVGA